MAPRVCVVDGYTSGAMYVAALRARGVHAIHVQSRHPIPNLYARAFVPSEYDANIVFAGDLADCARTVAKYRPSCIVPGMETGVNLADALGEILGLPTNGVALSACRREKYAMQKRIQDLGVRGVPTFLAHTWADAEAWITARGEWPVVMKPPASAATDGVRTCRDLASAERAFGDILGARNLFGDANHGVIVQPFITADEYIVNTASSAGHHALCSVWRVEKRRGEHTLYDNLTLQDYDTVERAGILDYTRSVLDALGIKYGAAHTEMFWSPDTGGSLIELGARLGGQKGSKLSEVGNGISIVEAVLDAYLSPERFFERYMRPYEIKHHVSRVELIAPRSGTLASLPRMDELRTLASCHEVTMLAETGQRIEQTTDLVSVPGFVDLLHPDAAVVAADMAKIRELEANGFYDITG